MDESLKDVLKNWSAEFIPQNIQHRRNKFRTPECLFRKISNISGINSALQNTIRMIQQHPHRPAHLFLDEQSYFITGAIYQKRPLLKDVEIKKMLLQTIQTSFAKYRWTLEHWVILDNHYHLLCKSKHGKDLSALIKSIHGASATKIVQKTNCEKPVWYNYWDYCPRNEHEYYTRLNYLLNNPIKHGYVNNLHDYPFSSFHTLFTEWGRERLAEQFRTFPTTTLEEAENDDF